MKKVFCSEKCLAAWAVFLIFSIIGLYGCKDDPNYYEKPEVSITPTPESNTFIFDQHAGNHTLTLKTNRKWSIATTGEDWIDVTPSSGDVGEHQISVTVLENGGAAREAQFTITASSAKFTFNVQQKGVGGQGIEYTDLSVLQEKAKDLDQNGITIEEDLRIRAVVTTHFEAKQFPFAAYHYIQDEKGGAIVATLIRDSGDPIPFGTEITANIKGCKLSNYNGTVQIELNGGDIVTVPDKPIEPREVTLQDLLDGKCVNQYIRIKGLQFRDFNNVVYYDGSYSTKRHVVQDKEGREATLEIWRTCVWGKDIVPSGSGTLTCVATTNTSKSGQVFHNLRPTQQSDIAFSEPRFEIGGGSGPGGGDLPSEDWDGGISSLREAFKTGKTSLDQDVTITAILINNPIGNMNTNRNLIVSDGRAGLNVFLSDKGLYDSDGIRPGDQLEITLKAGTSLSRYNEGSLQVQVAKSTDIKKVTNTYTVKPLEVTFADLMSDRINDDLESRLVKVSGVQFSQPGEPFVGEKNTYHQIQESASSQALEGFGLPSVFSSSQKYNKTGVETTPDGNGSITAATGLSVFDGRKSCNLFIRSAEDLALTDPRK